MTYIGLIDHLYGNRMRRFAEGVILVYCYLTLIALQALLAVFATSVFYSFRIIDSANDELTRILIIIAMNTVVIIPLSIPKEINAFRYTSSITVISLIYVTVVVFA